MTHRIEPHRIGMAQITVVVPVFNEQENVEQLGREILATVGPATEIIFVDDGSTDETVARLQAFRQQHDCHLRILRHRHNCGQSSAVYSGIAAASAEWVVTLDGDGQNDPKDIPALLAALNDSEAAADLRMVCGYRQKRNDSWLKRVSSRVANRIRAGLLKDDTPDTGCGLKLINRQAFMQLPFFDHMHRFLPALAQRQGMKTCSVAVSHRPRVRGVSKYGLHNRLWVGIVDLFGVMWLQSRGKQLSLDEL